MILRGKRVLARCDDGGELVVTGGRVEIRYGPKSPKAYQASPRNLSPGRDARIFEDDYCAAATDAPRSKTKKTTKKTAGRVNVPSKPKGDEVLAFCDGACSGNPGPAGLGAVMLWDQERKTLSEFLGKGTNNIAELTAIYRVVTEAPKDRSLRIFTDSTYSIGVLTKGWKAKANKELIADVKKALAGRTKVELHYVKGHAGIELNELADQLAVLAVESRASTGWIAESVG